MANDPTLVDLPEGTQTLLATNVTGGQLIKKLFGVSYTITYRLTGGQAPANSAEDGRAMQGDSLPIFAPGNAPIDVYGIARGGDGRLEVNA